jgi:hypothetical protein
MCILVGFDKIIYICDMSTMNYQKNPIDLWEIIGAFVLAAALVALAIWMF